VDLIKLATAFRALQMYSHHAHNMTRGESFHSDHVYFGDLYSFAESSYDSLIERYIGLGGSPSLAIIMRDTLKILSILPENNYYQNVLSLIHEVVKECEEVASKSSIGTNNLIAGIADSLEVHIYKIKRRLA